MVTKKSATKKTPAPKKKGVVSMQNNLLAQLSQFPSMQALATELHNLAKAIKPEQSSVAKEAPVEIFVFPSMAFNYYTVVTMIEGSRGISTYSSVEGLQRALEIIQDRITLKQGKPSQVRYFSRSGQILPNFSLNRRTRYDDDQFLQKTITFSEISPGKYFVLSPTTDGRLTSEILITNDTDHTLRQIFATLHWPNPQGTYNFRQCMYEVYNPSGVMVKNQAWVMSQGRWRISSEPEASVEGNTFPGQTLIVHYDRFLKRISVFRGDRFFASSQDEPLGDYSWDIIYLDRYERVGDYSKAVIYLFDNGMLIKEAKYVRKPSTGWVSA
jgi:hypothetical protein